MADTFSTYMQLLLMQDGSHPNQWGDLTNTNLSLIDQAMSQVTSIAVSSANYPVTNYAAAQSQARSLAFNVTGTLTTGVAIELPTGYPRLYVFYNQVTNNGSQAGQFPLTVQCGTGTPAGATVALAGPTTNGGSGVANLIYCDGTNCYGAQPPGEFAQLNVYEAFSAGTAWTPQAISLTGSGVYTATIDTSKSNEFYIEAPVGATSMVFQITNSAALGQLPGQTIAVVVSQNAAGGMAVSWPSGVLWPNGIVPTWSTAPNASDRVYLTYTYVQGTLTWVGRTDQDYGATGSSGGTYNVKITANAQDTSVLGLIGAVSGPVTVNITVNPGVYLTASSTGSYGLDCSGLPTGSIVNLFNAGYIAGKGGNGGPSSLNLQGISYGWYWGSGATPSPYAAGLPGGAAINGPGAGSTLNLYNTGHVWGGGGGGAGGGASANSGDCGSVSGAGGGGAGGGQGGNGFSGGSSGTFSNLVTVSAGANGLNVPNASAAGAASNGATWGANVSEGAGGAGGNWGAVGSNGAAATSHTYTLTPGLGGAAGPAITASGTINIPISGDIQGTT